MAGGYCNVYWYWNSICHQLTNAMTMQVVPTETLKEFELKEFELTFVVYDPRDPLGPLLALVTLTPVCVPACSRSDRGEPPHTHLLL